MRLMPVDVKRLAILVVDRDPHTVLSLVKLLKIAGYNAVRRGEFR